jgi:hypothetical protein
MSASPTRRALFHDARITLRRRTIETDGLQRDSSLLAAEPASYSGNAESGSTSSYHVVSS